MNNILWSAQSLGLFACLIALAVFNSWLSRKNQFFFFSRTVPEGFSATPQARQIGTSYIGNVWLGCLAAVAVTALLVETTRFTLYVCFTSGVFVLCICSCLAFARAHRLTGLALTSGEIDVRVPAPPQALPVSVPLLEPGSFTRALMMQMVLAPLGALLAWAVPMLVTHKGFGEYASAISVHGADFLSGLGLGLLAGSVLLFVQLKYFSRHRSRLANFTAKSCVMLAWFGTAATAISTCTVLLDWTITTPQKRFLLAVLLGVAVLRMIYAWTRSRQFEPPQVERAGDEFWRWGLFYYNPGDPTLFIQHRAGPGYTVNFANFLSWPLTFAVVADLVFLVCIHPYR